MRCGACNEVFDGNAALVEPAVAKAPMAPLPSSSSHAMSAELAVFDAAMSAIDTRAAETLQPDEAASIYTLDVESAEPAADAPPDHPADDHAASVSSGDDDDDADQIVDEPFTATHDMQPAADSADTPALAPSAEEALDLDLDVELDAEADAPAPHDAADAAPEAELPLIDLPADEALSAATIADDAMPSLDHYHGNGNDSDSDAARSPDHADDAAFPLDHADNAADKGRYPGDEDDLDPELAAKSDAEIAAELAALSEADAESEPSFDAILELAAELSAEPIAEAAPQDYPQDGRREPTLGEPPSEHLVAAALDDGYHDDLDTTREDDASAAAEAEADDAESGAQRDDNDADADAEVRVSAIGLARASAAATRQAADHDATTGDADVDADADADANADASADDEPEEPGFVKRDRRRQKMGKAARIVMSVGSVALLAGLLAQGIGTFRNQLAAELPQLKPALVSACAALGCKVELPTQIDDLSIEPGELQTIAENTFSFTTQLRNGGAITQAWPHIELVLNDNADKPVLRRVFAPRDYLATPADAAQGFAPHTEQSVKLYFEIAQLKASGYHIAVFYP